MSGKLTVYPPQSDFQPDPIPPPSPSGYLLQRNRQAPDALGNRIRKELKGELKTVVLSNLLEPRAHFDAVYPFFYTLSIASSKSLDLSDGSRHWDVWQDPTGS
ncbi:hypothetical protein ACEPAF_9961 [Sanghuangporus sanghuang]